MYGIEEIEINVKIISLVFNKNYYICNEVGKWDIEIELEMIELRN